MTTVTKFDVTLGDAVLLHEGDESPPTLAQIRVIRPEGHGISVGRFGIDAEGVALAERFDPKTGRSMLPESKRFLSTPDPFAGMPNGSPVARVRDADRVDRPVILPEEARAFNASSHGDIAAAFETIPESLRRRALAARDAEVQRLEDLAQRFSEMTWEEWLVEAGVTIKVSAEGLPPYTEVDIVSGVRGFKPTRFRLDTTRNSRYISAEEVARLAADADVLDAEAAAVAKGTR